MQCNDGGSSMKYIYAGGCLPTHGCHMQQHRTCCTARPTKHPAALRNLQFLQYLRRMTHVQCRGQGLSCRNAFRDSPCGNGGAAR